MAMSLQEEVRSTSSIAIKERVKSLVDQFRDSSDTRRSTWKAPLLSLPESVVTSSEFWDDWTSWLVLEYRIPQGWKGAGDPLHHTSAIAYLGCAMNLCKNQHKTEKARHFFACAEPKTSSDDASWYQGLRLSVRRHGVTRAGETGEKLDRSELPVYKQAARRSPLPLLLA